MAEIGRIALVVAFVVTAYLTVASALGMVWRQADLLASARRGVYAAAALVSLAWGVLLYAFATHDFSIQAVAQYNSRATDLAYSLSGIYAGQEGSLLMWGWGVVMVMLVATLQFKGQYKAMMPWVTAAMGFVATFFLSLLTFFADPFARTAVIPADGRGLNPLLQNIGMLVHPPVLYLGYVAFTVPFAFAIAALISGQLGDDWIRATRRWTLLAWAALGLGNILGAQWAYVELGWGGYWGWDPVENSSFMPWLTGTAFLHSVMAQKRRGMLKMWSLSLIIATFVLTVFGTFLTRSDILKSVHTFGETNIGPMFVAFMVLTIGVAIALIWDRQPLLQGEGDLESMVSRESSMLLNNLLLVGATFAIFWGTMYPVFSEAISGNKITVSAPFFNQVIGPILLAIVLLMGICPLIGWRRVNTSRLKANLLVPSAVALAAGTAGLLLGASQLWAVLAVAAPGFVAGTVGQELVRGVRAQARLSGRGVFQAAGALLWNNKPRYGAYLVHLSIALMAIGVVGSQGFKLENEVSLSPGQETTIGSYRLVYERLEDSRTATKEVVGAVVNVYSGNTLLGQMTPTKEMYKNFEQPNTEVAIRSTFTEDLYLILAGWDTNEKASFKFEVIPLVSWLWAGGYLLLLGTVVAYWPTGKGHRQEVRQGAESVASGLRPA